MPSSSDRTAAIAASTLKQQPLFTTCRLLFFFWRNLVQPTFGSCTCCLYISEGNWVVKKSNETFKSNWKCCQSEVGKTYLSWLKSEWSSCRLAMSSFVVISQAAVNKLQQEQNNSAEPMSTLHVRDTPTTIFVWLFKSSPYFFLIVVYSQDLDHSSSCV